MIVRAACVQSNVVFNDPEANVERAVEELHKLSDQGVQLAIFPEAFLTGYCVESPDEARGIALGISTKLFSDVITTCEDENMHCVIGLAEAAGDAVYNSAVLITPQGATHIHRKVHLPELGLDKFVQMGDALQVFDTAIGRIGVLICFDMRPPEAARVLALKGADIIALPTNWPVGAEVSAEHICIARAAENRVFFLTCNRTGGENGFSFIGRSKIIAPTGKVLAAAGSGEETIVAELDLEEARQKRTVTIPGRYETEVFASRRPELYSELACKFGLNGDAEA